MTAPPHFDVLIIGAGLSGIGMAHHLQRLVPGTTYAILEGRQRIGGTWDLFRYPGIRSDSDMHSFGYRFRPWLDGKVVADGATIRTYIEDTAADAGIGRHIRFGATVKRADWSSADALWTVQGEVDGVPATWTCRFLIACAGYFSYARGHRPEFEGEADFAGPIVHPQFWPEDLDWAGKRVAVIGSGATAVTLLPALAEAAAGVTMVQRSPSYVAAQASRDGFANAFGKVLPKRAAARLTRWKSIGVHMLGYKLARSRPEWFRKQLAKDVVARIGAERAGHFDPRYNPWDERLCLDPDGSLFDAMASGKAEVVTGTINRFTPEGIRMADGRAVPADIIVTATGLQLTLAGGVRLSMDGVPVRLSDAMAYKGVMFSGVPNFASIFGYTNASWTLKSDLAAEWICRLLRRMTRRGESVAMAPADPSIGRTPMLDFKSGYVQRSLLYLPAQGTSGPWRLKQNYLTDVMRLRYGRLDDGVLTFQRHPRPD